MTALFLESLGAYTVSFGFGLDDERQHSPNEFFRLSNFVRGQRAYCKLLHGLAGCTAPRGWLLPEANLDKKDG